MKPRAIMEEKRTPMITSALSFALSATGPSRRATSKVNPRAVGRGSTSRKSPKAAPAKAAWDMQKPMEERFILRTKIPTREHTKPASTDPTMAVIRSLSGRVMMQTHPLEQMLLYPAGRKDLFSLTIKDDFPFFHHKNT